MTALDDWGEALASWALPEEILQRTRRSPWEFPWELFRRRAEAAIEAEPTPSASRALEALPRGGSVLDVGAGPGAAGLALARKAGRITALDPSQEALVIFEALAERAGVEDAVMVGTWPEAAADAPVADVIVCHHVLYNVAELEPFVTQLTAHARRRVVCEITAQHPRAEINDLWKRLHDLDRPDRPTADDAERALAELGVPAHREDWSVVRSPEPRDELIGRLLTELALEPDEEPELVAALGDRLREIDGGWSLEPRERRLVTFWWDAA